MSLVGISRFNKNLSGFAGISGVKLLKEVIILDTSHETEVPLLFRLETFSTSATQSNILSTLFRTLSIALVPCICLHVGVVFLNCLAVVSASALEFQLTSRWRFLFLRFAVGFAVVGFFATPL